MNKKKIVVPFVLECQYKNIIKPDKPPWLTSD